MVRRISQPCEQPYFLPFPKTINGPPPAILHLLNMYMKLVAGDLFFDELYLVAATVCSRLTMLDAPFLGLLCHCLYRKLLEQGQFSDTLESSYFF